MGAAVRRRADGKLQRKCAEIASSAHRNFMFAMAAGIVAMLIWAATSRFSHHLELTGTVAAAPAPDSLSAPVDGTVTALPVHAGDHVTAGDVVMIVEQGRAVPSRDSTAQTIVKRAEIARLDAELSDARTIRFPAGVAGTEIAVSEDSLFHERASAQNQQRAIADSIVAGKKTALDGLKEKSRQLEATKALVDENLATISAGAATPDQRRDVMNARTAEQELAVRISDLQFEINGAEAALSEAQARRASIDAEFLSAAAAERARAVAALEGQTQPEKPAAIAHYEVRATTSGVVRSLAVPSVGTAVRAGVPLATIASAPAVDGVDVLLPAFDRSDVSPGSSAWLTLPAYDDAIYGGVHGVVTAISSAPDARTDGAAAYRVHIAANFASWGPDTPVAATMPVNVTFTNRRHTLLELLLTPLDRLAQQSRTD